VRGDLGKGKQVGERFKRGGVLVNLVSKLPGVNFSCDTQGMPFYLEVDFSSAHTVHVLSRHSMTLPKNI
jgi:hypothetical protein